MIKRTIIRRRGGDKTQIRVVEAYRQNGKTRQRTVKSFGYLEDQKDQAAFLKSVEQFDERYKQTKRDSPLHIEISENTQMYSEGNRTLNYGYKYLSAVFNALGIDDYIEKYKAEKDLRIEYDLAAIFKFLIIMRIMHPDSKRATAQLKNEFYNMKLNFSLLDVYRALDHFHAFSIDLQRYLNGKVSELIGRDLTHAFYDVTNYYFEIDFPFGENDIRQKGVSKEHRTDPIVAMGLFMDGNGLPVCMQMFKGNESDTKTFQPVLKDMRKSYGVGRIIAVADKGINSSKNIEYLVNNDDGFVFSQILRGTKGKRYHDIILDPDGWMENEEQTYKYKLFTEEYTGLDSEGNKVTRTRKVLLYWDKNDADWAAKKREQKLSIAERSVKNNAYGIKKGVDEYTEEYVVAKDTGEIIDDKIKKVRAVNNAKAERDALFDGYFCIVTSELDYDERKIRQVYGSLWRIEQSFRIIKSDLFARPVYVWTNDHIQAHFLICFVALLLVRIIQHKMGEQAISAERIAETLNAATCKEHKGGYVLLDDVGGRLAYKKVPCDNGKSIDTLVFSGDDQIALDFKLIQSLFHSKIVNCQMRVESFNRLLKNISL